MIRKKSTRESAKEQQKVFLAQDVISAAEKLIEAIKKAREGGVLTTMTTTTHNSMFSKVSAFFHHQDGGRGEVFTGQLGGPLELRITGGDTTIDVYGKTIRLWSIGEDR